MNITSIRKIVAVSIASFIFTLSAHAAFDFHTWPNSRNIETAGQSGMVKVNIPNDMTWSKDDFSDLRVIDGQGGEVPYLITRNISSTNPTIRARLLNLSTSLSGATRFIADTGVSGVIHTSISIETSSANFRRQVSIYASDTLRSLDDAGWSLVTNSGYIFKFTDPYTSYTSGKNSISFPANASRYFRVIISDGVEGPVSVTGASLAGDVTVEQSSNKLDVTTSIYHNSLRKTSEVTIDLGAIGRISSSVTLNPTDANYSRRVIVEANNSDNINSTSSWRYVGEGSISRVTTKAFNGYSNTVNYPEQLSRYIRVSIVNDDNPVLTLSPKATVGSPVISLIFDAQAGKSYRLYYGNSKALRPQYDISNMSQYIEEKALPVASLGLEVVNQEYIAPKGPVVPFTETHKGLLNVILVLMVILICAAIIAYLRKYVNHKSSIKTDSENRNDDSFSGSV